MAMTWLPDSEFTREPSRIPVLRDPNHVSGLGPERHTITVAKHFGDWYATCGCMAVSLPSWNQAAAERWVCPRAEAEVTVLRNKVRWEARVADAAVRARD